MRKLLLFASLAVLAVPLATRADTPGRHPFYLHALSDLRAARWLVEHRPGDMAVNMHENAAIGEIDAAIGEIKRAAIDDGKDLRDHPWVDATGDRGARLHRAVDLLHKVHGDVAREEDDAVVRGLRNRAVVHIDRAIHEADGAIWDVEHYR
jgi:hypothetical protein